MSRLYLKLLIAAFIVARASATINISFTVDGPTSCESCTVFDGARWCQRNLMCYLPNTDPTHDGTETVEAEIEKSCSEGCGGDQCSGIFQCFATANNTCGDCVFSGGWWLKSDSYCFLGGMHNRKAWKACGPDETVDSTTCARIMQDCEPCSRVTRPLYCSRFFAVVIVSGILAAVFFMLLTGLCIAAARHRQETKSPTSTEEMNDATVPLTAGAGGYDSDADQTTTTERIKPSFVDALVSAFTYQPEDEEADAPIPNSSVATQGPFANNRSLTPSVVSITSRPDRRRRQRSRSRAGSAYQAAAAPQDGLGVAAAGTGQSMTEGESAAEGDSVAAGEVRTTLQARRACRHKRRQERRSRAASLADGEATDQRE